MNNLMIIVFVVLIFQGVAKAVHFVDCGSKVGQFEKVDVSNCNTEKLTCDLIRGTDSSIGITFTPSQPVSSVKSIVHGIIDDIDIPFPLPNDDACADPNSGTECPLKANVPVNYQATLPVLRNYPMLSLKVKWELQNESEEDIVCVIIPVSIR